MANLLQKIISDRSFDVTIADADTESLKSIHTIFDKFLDHMPAKSEQNRMVRTRVLRGKVFGTPTPYCPVIFCPDPDRTEK